MLSNAQPAHSDFLMPLPKCGGAKLFLRKGFGIVMWGGHLHRATGMAGMDIAGNGHSGQGHLPVSDVSGNGHQAGI